MGRNSFLDAPSFRGITRSQRGAIERRRSRSRVGGRGTSRDPIRRLTEQEIRQRRLKQLQDDIFDKEKGIDIRLTEKERQAILSGKPVSEVRKQITQRQRKASLKSLQQDLSRTGTKLSEQQAQSILSGTPVGEVRRQVAREKDVQLARQRGERTQAATVVTPAGVSIRASQEFGKEVEERFGREGQKPEAGFSAPASFETARTISELERARQQEKAMIGGVSSPRGTFIVTPEGETITQLTGRTAPQRIQADTGRSRLQRASTFLKQRTQEGSVLAATVEPVVSGLSTAESIIVGGERRREVGRRASELGVALTRQTAAIAPTFISRPITSAAGLTEEEARQRGISTRPTGDVLFSVGGAIRETLTPETTEEKARFGAGVTTALVGVPAVRTARRVGREIRLAGRESVPATQVFDEPTLEVIEQGGRAFPTVSSVEQAERQFLQGVSERGGFEVVSASPQPLRGSSRGVVVVGEGPRGAADLETAGLFTAPLGRGSPQFLGINRPSEVSTGFSLIPDTAPFSPTVSVVRTPGVRRIDREVLEQGVAAENLFLRQERSGSAFITGNIERAFDRGLPGRATTEAEAVITPGTVLSRVRAGRQRVTRVSGGRLIPRQVEIQEFDVLPGVRGSFDEAVPRRSRTGFGSVRESDFSGRSGFSSSGLRRTTRVQLSAFEPLAIGSRASRSRVRASSRSLFASAYSPSAADSSGVSSPFSLSSSGGSLFRASGLSVPGSPTSTPGPSTGIPGSPTSTPGPSTGSSVGVPSAPPASPPFVPSRPPSPPPRKDFDFSFDTDDSSKRSRSRRDFRFESSIVGIELGKRETDKRATGFTGIEVRGI